MKFTTLVMLAVGASILVSTPLAAQPWDRGDRGGGYRGDRGDRGGGYWDLDRRIYWLQERIDRGRRDGSLDWREARRAQDQLNRISWQKRRAERNNGGQLGWQDRRDLQDQLDSLSRSLRWMRNDNDFRLPWLP